MSENNDGTTASFVVASLAVSPQRELLQEICRLFFEPVRVENAIQAFYYTGVVPVQNDPGAGFLAREQLCWPWFRF